MTAFYSDRRWALAGSLCVFWAMSFAPHAAAEGVRFYTHVAQKGDTLSKIAHRYQVKKRDWQSLQKLNRLSDPNRIAVGRQIRIPVPAMRTEPAQVKVLSMQGGVQSSAGQIAPGSLLHEGDRLNTADGGFVTLQLADGSTLTVQSKSAVKLESTRQYANTGGVPDSVVRLESGRVETSVTKQKSAAARYEIRTPTSNMGVRGTVFRVGADESGKRAQSEVIEGRVGVSSTSPQLAANELPLNAGFGTIAEAGKAPLPPIALLPAPVFTGLPARTGTRGVTFAFSAVADAKRYSGQVARDAAFTDIVSAASAEGPSLRFEELPAGSLYFRARAIDINGLEGKDASHAFQSAVLAAPQLPSQDTVIPTVGAIVPAATLRFAWDAVDTAASYRLQISPDREFKTVAFEQSNVDKAELSDVKGLPSGEYYWRVAAIGQAGEQSAYSPVRHFVLRADRLKLNRAVVSGSKVTMTWNADPGLEYEWQLGRDERFRDIAAESRVKTGEVSVDGIGRGFYFARVRPVLAGRQLPWSDAVPVEVYSFSGSK